MYPPAPARPQPKRWWLRALLLVVALLALWFASQWLRGWLGQETKPQRQVARIAILPDTPPPPPPPPPPQREEPKQVAQAKEIPQAPAPQEQPKPASEALKMEGPAGDGPSAFAAGAVTQDYRGGPPVVGGAAGANPGGGIDRARERLFANAARQQLRDEIERRLRADTSNMTAEFSIWLDSNGRISRFAVQGMAKAEDERALRAALDELVLNVRLPEPPSSIVQPLRFRLQLRPQA